jgi:hypothetical protein
MSKKKKYTESRMSQEIQKILSFEYAKCIGEKITKTIREAMIREGKDHGTRPTLGLAPCPGEPGFYIINKKEQVIITDIFINFIKLGSVKDLALYCKVAGYTMKPKAVKGNVEKINIAKKHAQAFTQKSLHELLTSTKIRGTGKFTDSLNQFPEKQDANGWVTWKYRHGNIVPTNLIKKVDAILAKNK